jgi:hypothetical protein
MPTENNGNLRTATGFSLAIERNKYFAGGVAGLHETYILVSDDKVS